MFYTTVIKNYLGLIISLISISNNNNVAYKNYNVTINVKDFGAKGDGKTDDYAALSKVANYISEKGGGEVYFPPGVYYIADYHNGQNNINDLQFENCNGLKIYGSKAVISVNGNFNRSLTSQNKKHKFSNIKAITPLKIFHCKNVIIENLELNGNVNKMTRDSGVIETGGHLLIIEESQNVNINNLYIHHAQTDGIYIRGDSTMNITANKIISSNNARQGMSIIQLTNGTFTDCQFINTGITDGAYRRHQPSAGVDIEPNTKQQKVENIHFINCLFQNNMGSQFVCSSPVVSQYIYLNNCTFIANVNSIKYSIIVNAVNVIFTNCSFDCKNGSIYPVWKKEGSSSVFKKCNIKSNGSGFIAVSKLKTNKVVIDSCKLEYTGTQKIKSFFPYIRMQNLSFTNNTVNIPKQYYKDKGLTILIQNVHLNTNNKFSNN